MLTMDKMMNREHDAIMQYCEDMFNEWRTQYSPNKAAQRKRFERLELAAECRRIDDCLANGVDPYASTQEMPNVKFGTIAWFDNPYAVVTR